MKPLALALLLTACSDTQVKRSYQEIDLKSGYGTVTVQTAEVDGCQYLLFYKTDCLAVVHSGSCNNPIHHLTNSESK